MFWKLALTAAVVLVITGQTAALRNPMIRLLLPRSWAIGLSALPTRRGPSRPKSAGPPKPWLDRRVRIALVAIALIGFAAWLATRAIIGIETEAVPDLTPA